MKEADMRKKICPVMSRPTMGSITGNTTGFVLCQGSACLAFDSRPTYVYLGKDGGETTIFGNRATFVPEGVQASLVKEIVDKGWTQQGSGTNRSKVSFRREAEPNCWCDAMPANAQCGYEAP